MTLAEQRKIAAATGLSVIELLEKSGATVSEQIGIVQLLIKEATASLACSSNSYMSLSEKPYGENYEHSKCG